MTIATDQQLFARFGDPREHLGADGKPTEAWKARTLVYIKLPTTLPASWNSRLRINRVLAHRIIAPIMSAALRELQENPVAWASINDCGGCYEFRSVSGLKRSLSRHALGIALDLDVTDNPFLGMVPRVNKEVLNIMRTHGFCWGGAVVWGGDFPWGRRDAMHWEPSAQLVESL
jgi:hypothetical protein